MKTLPFASGFLLVATALSGQQYVISTIAGGGPLPSPVSALSLPVGIPQGVATDKAGNFYFASLNCVFKVDQNGVMTRVAGNARAGYSGDGGPAPGAQLAGALAVAVDGAGNLFIADTYNSRIRRVSTTGIITTIAGNGVNGYSGDGGPAVSAQLANPTGIAVDGSGSIFFSDTTFGVLPALNNRVRMVSPNGIISTVAGNGTYGASGDGGPAIAAQLASPQGVAVDASGNLFIADIQNNRIRKVANGTITTVAGNGTGGFSGDNGPAASAQLALPNAVAADASGNLFIADEVNNRIRKVANGIISTVAGSSRCCSSAGDGGPAVAAELVFPTGVAVDGSGSFFIVESGVIRKVSSDTTISTVAGSMSAASGDGPALNAQLSAPNAVAVDGAGNVFVADYNNNRVRKITKDGVISVVAGNGTSGSFSGDGGPATSAAIWGPDAVAVDGSGNLFISDNINRRVRKVSTSGIITTVAGNGTSGFSGDGGQATNAALWNPYGVAVDSSGNLFIADPYNSRVRKVSANGIITTVAGGGNSPCCDGSLATSVAFGFAEAIAVDGQGNLFIADSLENTVYKVDAAGIITTVGGSIPGPNAVAVDSSGNVFVAEDRGDKVWKISADGSMIPVAGNGSPGFSGDGGFATSAQLNLPFIVGLHKFGLAVDPDGKIFIADSGNNAVRLLTPTPGSMLIGAVVDAASESAGPVSPGKIVVIYGGGLGPSQLIQNQPGNGVFGTQLAGTTVSFNGTPAPMIYTSATQVAAIVPYGIDPALSATAQVTVSYQGSVSSAFSVPVAASAPSLFTANQTGAGQIATVNGLTGVYNDAGHPVRAGDFLELFATGEGQTTPAGVDGKLATVPYPTPNLPVSVTVGGIPVTVSYKGGAPTEVAGLMQINIQIPPGVQPGGYVPIVLTVGNTSTVAGAVWIAVADN
jgi:trimeric autotransporter adhesin